MHRLTLKTFAAQGKPVAAKNHYELMTKLLNDEFGINPSNQTRRIAAELGIQ